MSTTLLGCGKGADMQSYMIMCLENKTKQKTDQVQIAFFCIIVQYTYVMNVLNNDELSFRLRDNGGDEEQSGRARERERGRLEGRRIDSWIREREREREREGGREGGREKEREKESERERE